MVNILASRAAAKRLAAIVAVFLIPLSVLSFWIIDQTRANLETLERERAGVELLLLVAPMMLKENAAQTGSDPIATFVMKGEPLALGLGIKEEFQVVATGLQRRGISRDQFAAIQDLMMAVGTHSRLTRDSISENLFLARTVAEVLPRNWGHVLTVFSDASAASVSSNLSLERLAFSRGELAESLKELRQTVGTAANESDDDDRFSKIVETLTAYELLVQGHIAKAERSAGLPIDREALRSDALQAEQLLAEIWNRSAERLSVSLAIEYSRLWQQLWWTNGGVLATVVLGLAGAVFMFRSTLRRLDDVVAAKQYADMARIDSETVNSQLTEINSDIVRLNQELADKMRRLKDAQDELVRKGRLEQLGQLTATVAHELRNPLGAVRTAAFLLERKVKDKGLGVEGQLLRINNGVSRCDGIITQLLDFSRTRQVSAEALDLDEWMERLLEEESRRLSSAVSINLNLGLENLQVEFDPARLQRAIINLINNASEAMIGQGNDEAKNAAVKPTISISTYLTNGSVAIDIVDNGPGIPEELLAKIRDPLFTTKSFGTGLGIPAVEQIVIQHGGTLSIESAFGKGATFRIVIPVKQPIEEAA